ncbi:MAG: DUF2905 domain-containing protein [Acidimicrobiia bacterium]|jgi:hypothetical protein
MRVGSVLMLIGTAIVVLGALIRFVPGLFGWFGNLPGDIDIRSENSRVFIPITSMLVVSAAATAIISLLGLLFRDR